jgi:hypothetical protein
MSRRMFVAFLASAFAIPALAQQGESNPLGEPKASIAYQLKLLERGDVAKLKECFTERQKGKITPEVVARGKQELANATLDELVAKIQFGMFDGKKTARITMKNGRTLTTLVQTDGKWLADTLWFR